jgi:hypothetical protein
MEARARRQEQTLELRKEITEQLKEIIEPRGVSPGEGLEDEEALCKGEADVVAPENNVQIAFE